MFMRGYYLPLEIYQEHLKKINGIEYTLSETKIITFLSNGRSSNAMAAFFETLPRSVGNRISDAMRKSKCATRDALVDFVQKSPDFFWVRQYYVSLLLEGSFKKLLREASTFINKGSPPCSVLIWEEPNLKRWQVALLKEYLVMTGIKAISEYQAVSQNLNHFIHSVKESSSNQAVIIASNVEGLHRLAQEIKEKGIPTQRLKNVFTFLCVNPDSQGCSIKELGADTSIDWLNLDDYYNSFFVLLKKLVPNINLIQAQLKLRDQVRLLYPDTKELKPPHSVLSFFRKHRVLGTLRKFVDKERKIIGLLTVIILASIGSLSLFLKVKNTLEPHNQKQFNHNAVIRSDLPLPAEAALLSRPLIIDEINRKLKGDKGIQTVALVGIGGSGKTTLARQYALQQHAPVVWEINAEKKGQLLNSFEKLAYAISSTETDKEKLKNILEIQNSSIKEQEVLLFIKEKLRTLPGWILIYDNVDNFKDIQSYFPLDSNTWGTGRVILTTRDSNIQHNSHIKNIVQIGELTLKDKLSLFMKIMDSANVVISITAQQKEVKKLMERIPSFPLDVSIAAYYLRMTNISYDKYIEYLSSYNKDFASVQGYLLNETGDYTKTRYEIITLSIKQLMDLDKDFIDLLLFVSLLDSQNIPRSLLDEFKNNFIVDKFIFHLNKCSLIAMDSTSSTNTSFSMHRSTQAIVLAHLLNHPCLVRNRHLISTIVKILENYSMEAVAHRDFEKMQHFSKHGEAFLRHEKLLTEREIITIGGELLHINCWLSKDRNKLINFIENLKVNNFQNDPLFARNLSYLGICYWGDGHFKKAQNLLEQSIRIYTEASETDYVQMARALVYLGMVKINQGHLENALKVLEQSITIYKNQNYQNCVEMAFALTQLGAVQNKLGYCEIARDSLLKSLLIYRKNEEEDRPHAGWAFIILSWVYSKMEEFEKAKIYCEHGSSIYKKHFPENSLSMGWALRNLGVAHCEVKNYKEAQKLLRKSLEIFKRILGDNNIKTYWILFEIGTVNKKIGNTREAKSIYKKCLKKYKEFYCENTVDVGICLNHLGEIALEEDNFELAMQYLCETYKIYLENKFVWTYKVLEDLAELYLKKSKIEEYKKNYNQSQVYKTQAVSYLKKALNLVKKSIPGNSRPYIRINARLKALDFRR